MEKEFLKTPALLDELVEVWEASVRATHTFLSEDYINKLRPLVRDQYLPQVDLYVCRDEQNQVTAFMGLSEDLIEMLFVRPDMRGQGCGVALVAEARRRGIRKVDVNEENGQARGFYEHMGFKAVSRDAFDPEGQPHPILHLEYDGCTR